MNNSRTAPDSTASQPPATAQVRKTRQDQVTSQEILANVQQLVEQALRKQPSQRGILDFCLTSVTSLVLMFGLYTALLPFHGTFVGRLFWHQHIFGPLVTFLALFSVASLFWRYMRILRQRRIFKTDLLPRRIGNKITFANAPLFLSYLEQLNISSNNILANRLRSGLAHFISKKNTQDVNSYLETQSNIDAHSCDSGYSGIRFIIWLLPILGFIGTVYGIGSAVSGFSGAINSGSDIALIKDSLTQVTSGLGTSFNTTLLALVLSIIVMYPRNMVQKAEEAFLVRVDSYCQENFFRRMQELVAGKSADGKDFVKAFEQVLGVYQKRWRSECTQLAENLSSGISARLEGLHEKSEARNQKLYHNVSKVFAESTKESSRISSKLESIQDKQLRNVDVMADRLAAAAATIKQQFELIEPVSSSNSDQLRELVSLQEQFIENSTTQIRNLCKVTKSLHKQLESTADQLRTTSEQGSTKEMMPCFKAILRELRQISTTLAEKPEARVSVEARKPQLTLFQRLFNQIQLAETVEGAQ